MDVQIRVAQPADLGPLGALARQTYTDAYAHEMPAQALSEHLELHLSPDRLAGMLCRDVVLLAEVAGCLVGFVQFGATRPEYRSDDGTVYATGDDLELRRLYVLAGFQNQGLGGVLMRAAFEHFWLTGRRVFLTVWHTNVAAQRFYARHHFRQIGIVPLRGGETGFDLLLLRDIRQS
ncbi:GNAT family N-acetyltransferase [Deinococcus radiomollis]|uniref:GNAT family N-acetyltransferase n=1 Tax=Deinococcus radiomollis TaxID=468916 RepID=UPI0038915015